MDPSREGTPPPRFDVTSLGESMLRLSVPPGGYLANATSFDVHVGGSESNVCAALAQLGRRCGWFSALPDSPLGRLVLSRLREVGIDTSGVRLARQGRVGVYYLESPPPPKASAVVYDRAGSAFSRFDLDEATRAALLDTRIVHLTGITPSLGPGPRAAVEAIVEEARRRRVTVSFDVNYRERLWPTSEALPLISSLLERADILFCSLRDVTRLFGPATTGPEAAALLQRRCSAELVVVSLGERGVYASCRGEGLSIPAVPTAVIDRPGAGDAMAAGVLDGYLDGDVRAGLERGVMLASTSLSHYGDMVYTDRRELMQALSDRGGDISR